jgi:hypothetical protein
MAINTPNRKSPNKGEISNFNKIAKQLFPNWQAEQISILTSRQCCDNSILDVTYDCDEGNYVATTEKPIAHTDGSLGVTGFLFAYPTGGGNPEIVAGPAYNIGGKVLTFPGNLVTGNFTFILLVSYSSPAGFNITTNKIGGVMEYFTTDFNNPITIPACP